MKKFGILVTVFIITGIFYPFRCAYAYSTPYVVIGENIWLCDKETGKKLFLLPESYYAEVVGIEEEYYTVRFNGVEGFVEKTAVEVTGYEGEAKGTTQTLYVSSKYSSFTALKLRAYPEEKEETTSIPTGEPFFYIGSYPYGEQVWYYVCYGDSYGYVLSSFCDKLVTAEEFTPEQEEKPQEITPETEEPDLVKILIICGISVVVIIILLVLFLPKKGKRKNRYYYES